VFSISVPRNVNLSTVQGSGLHPSLSIYDYGSDLQRQSQHNILTKYADDTNLLVPQHTDC